MSESKPSVSEKRKLLIESVSLILDRLKNDECDGISDETFEQAAALFSTFAANNLTTKQATAFTKSKSTDSFKMRMFRIGKKPKKLIFWDLIDWFTQKH